MAQSGYRALVVRDFEFSDDGPQPQIAISKGELGHVQFTFGQHSYIVLDQHRGYVATRCLRPLPSHPSASSSASAAASLVHFVACQANSKVLKVTAKAILADMESTAGVTLTDMIKSVPGADTIVTQKTTVNWELVIQGAKKGLVTHGPPCALLLASIYVAKETLLLACAAKAVADEVKHATVSIDNVLTRIGMLQTQLKTLEQQKDELFKQSTVDLFAKEVDSVATEVNNIIQSMEKLEQEADSNSNKGLAASAGGMGLIATVGLFGALATGGLGLIAIAVASATGVGSSIGGAIVTAESNHQVRTIRNLLSKLKGGKSTVVSMQTKLKKLQNEL